MSEFTFTEKDTTYVLISFSPASGIGFYSERKNIHGELSEKSVIKPVQTGHFMFDIVDEEQFSIDQDGGTTNYLYEFDQIQSGLSFNRLRDLLAFAQVEYLRDKKNIAYWAVCTENLAPELLQTTLELLNSDELETVTFSLKLKNLLREKANPDRVFAVIEISDRLELRFVQRCLTSELSSIVFAPAVLINRAANAVGEASQLAGRYLSLLARCVQMVDRIPRDGLAGFHRLKDAVENQLGSLQGRDFASLEFCFERAGITSTSVNMANAALLGNTFEIKKEMSRLLGLRDFRGVDQLLRFANKIEPQRNELFSDFGHRIVSIELQERQGSLNPPGFFVGGFRRGLPSESLEVYSMSLFERIFESLTGKTVLQKLETSLVEFSMDNDFHVRASNERWYPEYLSHVAFLVGLYAEPEKCLRIFLGDITVSSFEQWYLWWLAQVMNFDRTDINGPADNLLYSARARVGANLLSVLLLSRDENVLFGEPSPRSFAHRIIQANIENLKLRGRRESTEEIFARFANNTLLWAKIQASHEAYDQILAAIMTNEESASNVSPFFRIVF